MSVLIMLAIFFVALLTGLLFNYFFNYEDEFSELKQWDRFRDSFNRN